MYWNDWAKPLQDLLGLGNQPIGVTWSHTGAVDATQEQKLSACEVVFRAMRGETGDVTAGTCACQGGLVNLGLGEIPSDSMARLSDYLVNKAKAYASPAALTRGQRSVRPPRGAGEHVVFAPLVEAALEPDLVLVVCDAVQAQQLVALCSYWDGGPLMVDLAGPMCRNALAYPLVNHCVGLSLFDDGARRRAAFGPEQMVVSIPLAQMILAIAALERGAGRIEHATA